MKSLERIIKNLDKVIEKSKQDAIKTIYGQLEYRVFNEGKKKDNTQIGKYTSEAYKKKRQAKGLQTTNVDLTFSTQLNKSVVSNSIDKVYFNNVYGQVIGKLNEKRYGRIFAPTATEREIFTDILNEELNLLINASN